MCPGCIATAALIIGGVISTGGVTAFVAKKIGADKFWAKTAARDASAQAKEKENRNGQRKV